VFARRESMHIKANSVPRFIDRVENEILPMLRKQKGFQDQAAFVTPSGSEAFIVSFWDMAENAEAYGRGAYADAIKILATVIEGSAQVEIFYVVSNTMREIMARATEEAAPSPCNGLGSYNVKSPGGRVMAHPREI